MVKTKNIFIFWAFISLLLFSCDPDEITSPPGANKIENNCKDNAIQLQCKKPEHSNKQLVTYNDEPKFTEQWYLHNTNIKGLDINILPVWQKGYGTKPVSIGIMDQGIDTKHPDLTNSVLITGFGGYDRKLSHGTKVAGIIAARDNQQGIIGVAPKAKIYSFSITINNGGQFINHVSNSFKHKKHRDIAVYNASLGFSFNAVGLRYRLMPAEVKKAIDDVTQSGFGNKGSSIVFAAGNVFGMATNDGYLHHYSIINVNAIKSDGVIPEISYKFGHTNGVNLWIIAPAGSYTTTNGGGYVDDFGRTSSAAPLVSGAIALLRSEYPTLTWRDVKLILAESATKYDNNNKAQYRKTGVFYSNSSTVQKYGRTMGFGLLNVEQAFSLAKNWKLLPAMKVQTHSASSILLSNNRQYSTTFSLSNDIGFIESLTLELVFKEELNFGWDIVITSPDGKDSKLIFAYMAKKMVLLFNTFLGSTAVGNWKIQINSPKDVSNEDVESVSLTLRGH